MASLSLNTIKLKITLIRLTLSALASVFCIAVAHATPLRVLTYNILASQPSWEVDAKRKNPGIGTWDKRMPLVIEIMGKKIDGMGYDFIGTQETSIHPKPELHQVNQLAGALPDYGSLYAAVSGAADSKAPKKFSISNMIFWRKDRWEIDTRDHGTFWLSDTPEVPGSNTWSPISEKTGKRTNKGGKRNVTYGLFHEIANGKRTGKKVYFYNTHLNVHVPDARVKSALLIMERIRTRAEQSAPVIVTGDFNSLRNDSRGDGNVYKYLTGNPIDFQNARHQPPLTLTEAFAATGPQDQLPRIDFIFSGKGLKPVSAANVDIRRTGVRGSDHAPIAAVLEWE